MIPYGRYRVAVVWRNGLNEMPTYFSISYSDLCNRLIKVNWGRMKSDFRHLCDGLSQGSVLVLSLINTYTFPKCAFTQLNIKTFHDWKPHSLMSLKIFCYDLGTKPNPTKIKPVYFHLIDRLPDQKENELICLSINLEHLQDFWSNFGSTLESLIFT